MKAAISLILGLTTLSQVAGQNWVQTWSDEFDGNSVNRNNWNIDVGNGGFGNNELQYYTDRGENVYVTNGELHIVARREDYGGNQYTSAKLTTAGHFETTYGKFEMRARLPAGQGMWPAFWMLGSNIGAVGWPACGEIDIMEVIGKDPNNQHGSLHAPNFDRTGNYGDGRGFHNDYHTYAAIWQPDYVQFYTDGNLFYTVNKNDAGGNWPFEGKNFFMILNLAVGGNWPGNPDGSTPFPNEYVIDYVRVSEIAWSAEELAAQSIMQ